MSLRKRAEPVTLVRSPTFTKSESRLTVVASKPDSVKPGGRGIGLRG